MSNELVRCRVCLGNSNDYTKCLSLFESYEESTVCAHISCLARVQIREGDGLPDRICPECLLQLGAALAFRRKCEASDKLLRGAALSQVPVEFKHEHDADDAPVKEEAEASDECDADAECAAPSAARPSRSVDLQLVCDDCQGRFKSKCKLRVHWKKEHLADKLVCPTCKKTFKTFKALHKHIKKKFLGCTQAALTYIEGQGKSRVFHCKQCPYKCKRTSNLRAHIVTHTGERPYQCDICDKRFTQVGTLNAHKSEIHVEHRVERPCPTCGKLLKSRRAYNNHLLTHSAKTFTCDICNATLKNKKILTIHMLRHRGIKEHACEYCAAMFYSLAELTNHRNLKHLKIKRKIKFKCNMCEYSTMLSHLLMKHKSNHTGTNVLCQICKRLFDNKEKLELHMKHHNERTHECHYYNCGKKYSTRRYLGMHISNKHRDDYDETKLKKNFGKIQKAQKIKKEIETISQ